MEWEEFAEKTKAHVILKWILFRIHKMENMKIKNEGDKKEGRKNIGNRNGCNGDDDRHFVDNRNSNSKKPLQQILSDSNSMMVGDQQNTMVLLT